jgi:hypothetical protein
MTNTLAKYDAAKHALAEARSVDEVKDIRDKSIAMKLYAKQAKDNKLEADAHEIRLRAERRLGEMMAEQKKAVGLNKGGKSEHRNRVSKKPGKPTLACQNIDKNLADRSREAAALSEEKFELKVEQAPKTSQPRSSSRSYQKSRSRSRRGAWLSLRRPATIGCQNSTLTT